MSLDRRGDMVMTGGMWQGDLLIIWDDSAPLISPSVSSIRMNFIFYRQPT
jgi:hypothetical protein